MCAWACQAGQGGYESEARTVREKTARLKALRLAEEAADLEAQVDKKPIASKTTLSI